MKNKMKLTLKKEAEFEFNESKYTAIPSEVFTTLVGEPDDSCLSEPQLPEMVMFENKTDYLSNAKLHDIDYNKSIYVSSKGQILCFLNTFSNDESANSEENKEQ